MTGAGGRNRRSGVDTDDLLANLAWGLIRDWRRRRDVDPAIRRAWERLYIGVIRRMRRRPTSRVTGGRRATAQQDD